MDLFDSGLPVFYANVVIDSIDRLRSSIATLFVEVRRYDAELAESAFESDDGPLLWG